MLPSEGRAGDPPDWPLTEHEVTVRGEREAQMWRRLWSRPQAVQWERMGQELEVALYVRRLVEAEAPEAPANLATLVRQMADALGLTIPGLRVNRWKIAGDQVAEKRAEKKATEAPVRRLARDRFKVVRGRAAG